MMEELDFEDEESANGHEEILEETENNKIENNLKNEKESDSDSGEIVDEEEPTDLEEGEIKDSDPKASKNSEIACRFFKRGTCMFGSQCQYLHVSDSVYKMFDPAPRRSINFKSEPPDFYKPLPCNLNFFQTRIEADPVNLMMPNPNFHRQEEVHENTWEQGLKQARVLIENANIKKKSEDFETKKLHLVPEHDKNEKTKGRFSDSKIDCGNKVRNLSSKKSHENELQDFDLKKRHSYDKKEKSKIDQNSDYQWVDPWRRSKSPPNKKRALSRSVSPRHQSRRRSYSSTSTSSSSSYFDHVYGRPYEKKSPKTRKRSNSRSRSISPSQQRKNWNTFGKSSTYRRRHSRSFSRSVTRSPPKKKFFRSRSRSRASSLSSCSDCEINTKKPIFDKKSPKIISAKNCEDPMQKISRSRSPSCNSDCETSEVTVSSISCTSVSSGSEEESSDHSPLIEYKKSTESKAPLSHKTDPYQTNSVNKSSPKSQVSNKTLFADIKKTDQLNPGDYYKNQVKRNDYKNFMHSRNESISSSRNKMSPFKDYGHNEDKIKSPNKPKNIVSVFDKNFVGKQMAEMQLGMNRRIRVPQGNNMFKQIVNDVCELTETMASNVNVPLKAAVNAPKFSNVSKKKITLNLQPKSSKEGKPEVDVNNFSSNVEKDSSSKRIHLLHQLKLIEDAIARKKHSA
ncbi:c3H1-type domain-containing protein [Trichonephila inaurata madagascariensis]|uniref:C3H1-type domain-containing protein n=1 Tax=Trichonephila inaurata madagascariensis TaxID=2747483 RepID=A0A8X6WU78_9ARAC|nr:c3H1-type domain-containing protein [Trichonephila inaurata madagascariensis]